MRMQTYQVDFAILIQHQILIANLEANVCQLEGRIKQISGAISLLLCDLLPSQLYFPSAILCSRFPCALPSPMNKSVITKFLYRNIENTSYLKILISTRCKSFSRESSQYEHTNLSCL